ncbi:MAG: TIGR02556 family CRISPR-associated protein [Nitrososphaerota archaeon]|nr:TIGR02556 family CRISPR-associated protein [Candidatus Bathyarchaeota archaeon]MDW8022875.1 TIGR02556 family CRISPR-associated protein [Nitrososphaerota archaeon]
MFGALKEIGEAVLSAGKNEFKIEKIKIKGRGGEAFLAKVIFNLDDGKLECDYSFKCTQKTAEEYLWIGNARGQKPQLVLTTDSPDYLLDSSKPKKWAIGQIIRTFDGKLGDTDVMNLLALLKEVELKFFSKRKSYVEDLEKLLGREKEQVALYTASVKKDGLIIDLAKEPGYKKLLHYVAYVSESDEYPVVRGVCHICGMEKDVLTNPSYREGTILCIYNLDKAGFMPELSRSPWATMKAHAVCVDCKRKLLLGLGFVEQKLTFTMGASTKQAGRVNVFLIPKVLGTRLMPETLDGVALEGNKAFGAVNTYKNLEEVEKIVEDMMELDKTHGVSSTYFLNILFGYGESSHFHFQHLIQDVPVMRLLDLSRIMTRISNEVASIFMEKGDNWSIGFEEIFSIFPLSVRKGKVMNWKPLVELFEALLSGTTYPKDNIISNAVLLAKIYKHGTYKGYNIKQPPKKTEEAQLCVGLLKYNMLLKLLREVGAIEMERESATVTFEIPDKDIEDFFSKMNYVEWQKALFLLGVLVGKIGIEQYKRGDSKKAVLNKINFEGMSAERIKLLANQVLEGLRNYRMLDDRNEAVYACMKAILDRNLELLKNPIDNVFYILSGYAYATLQAIRR